MVCVFPDDVCPYAKIVPLYPSRTSAGHHKKLVEVRIKWLLVIKLRLKNYGLGLFLFVVYISLNNKSVV